MNRMTNKITLSADHCFHSSISIQQSFILMLHHHNYHFYKHQAVQVLLKIHPLLQVQRAKEI